jgi:hypothetical protein
MAKVESVSPWLNDPFRMLDRYHPAPAGLNSRAADLWRMLQEEEEKNGDHPCPLYTLADT